MTSLLKICRSVIKKNKGFSVCLCLMSLLCFICSVLAANFASSTKRTIDNFFQYTGVPDVLVSTEFITTDELDDIRNIDGIKDISTRVVLDVNIETASEKRLSTRLLSYDETGPYKLEFQSKQELSEEDVNAYISYEFADYNNISLGDEISMVTPIGEFPVRVAARISSIETFKCIKDGMSNYEAYQFGYIYIPVTELDKVISTSDFTNSFAIYFEDGLTSEKQKQILEQVENELGIDFLSFVIVAEMESIKSIEDDIDTIKVLCVFIPGFVLLISLGFSFVFLKIVIENQRQTIGLLKSLGYSTAKITSVFILYTVLINLVALVVGLPAGFGILKLCVGLVASANGILSTPLSISYLLTVGLILVVFAIGVLASLLTSKSIAKIDPACITHNNEEENIEAPKLAKKIRCNPFIKISIVSILRKYKRLIVGFLCMAACIVTMCVGFEGNLTIAHPTKAIYGDRFRYDLMIRDVDESDYLMIKNDVGNIKTIEPLSFFESNVGDNKINVSTIQEGSELVVLKNNKGDVIYPGDGVVIDEMYAKINKINVGSYITLGEHSLQVTGIAREIAVTFFYISQNTAETLYSSQINCILLKAKDASLIDQIKKDIMEINPNAYFSVMSSQRENMDSRHKAISTFMLILSGLSFLIGSLFVFNISIIDFNEKKNEYATLRAMGASVNKLCIVSFIENITRLLIGIILAIPLSYVFVTVLLGFLSNASTQYVMVNFWPCLFISIGISLLYIVVSLLISRHSIKKMNIIERINEME